VEADLEILNLALDILNLSGLKNYRLALSHAGLLSAVVDGENLSDELIRSLHKYLAQKDRPAIEAALGGVSQACRSKVLDLLELYGVEGGSNCVMHRALKRLPSNPKVREVLSELQTLISCLKETVSSMPTLLLDLADVASFDYHRGLIFSAYVEDCPNAILRGGRYDDIGAAYGRARPATGFSVDLRELVSLQAVQSKPKAAVLAPWIYDTELIAVISELRGQGEVVLQSLPNTKQEEEEFICDRQLVKVNTVWKVMPIGMNQEK
jgi:ATP phosphoribosyltransferase regulatory subunit